MEENLEKYSKLLCPGWQVHLFMLEVGCRGFVPSRFSFSLRQLGFTPLEFRKLRDNLQLIARKCSYVIWLNRFNKDFNSTLRVSVDGLSVADGVTSDIPIERSPLLNVVKDRIARNHKAALGKLRATHNRRSALLKLRAACNRSAALFKLQSKFIYSQSPATSLYLSWNDNSSV